MSLSCVIKEENKFSFIMLLFYRVFRNYFYLALMVLSGSNPLGFTKIGVKKRKYQVSMLIPEVRGHTALSS